MVKGMKTLYKSLPASKKPNGFRYKLNTWHKIDGDISICNNGFHASQNIIDAMKYVACGYIAKVEVRGESIKQDDKECWTEMKIVEWHKWTKKDSVSLAIFAAELVLVNFEKEYPGDMRPRQTIEAAKSVLKKDSEKNREAARAASSADSAAESAVSAASSAVSAAESAVSAAESAVSAAWAASAASSAVSAAWSASAASSAARAASTAYSAESAVSAASAAFSAVSTAYSAHSAALAAESAVSAASAAFKKTMEKCHNFVLDRKFE
jgi:hypothetical protein